MNDFERRTGDRWRRVWVGTGLLAMAVALVGLVGLGVVATSGTDAGRTSASVTAGEGPSLPPRVAVPNWSADDMRAALAGPKQLGRTFKEMKLPRQWWGLIDGPGVTGCYERAWRPEDGGLDEPALVERYGWRKIKGQLGGDGYAIQALVYRTEYEAAAGYVRLEWLADHCAPTYDRGRREYVQYRGWGGRRWYSAREHERWSILGRDSGPNWGALRVLERRDAERATLGIRTVRRVVDYVWRGSVILVQTVNLYQRGAASGDAGVLAASARMLDRTVHAMDAPQCVWGRAYMWCRTVPFGTRR
ncbi:hypothetical protein [Actinomadura oligospora]|uniref:hypothetical protein n=1 Tax=Actinomadura oligospora TaxID=111804 RepID=UPI00047938E5|nr:hypothetical protein [Actinomadura oligospora]